jgi:hypothetical protein
VLYFSISFVLSAKQFQKVPSLSQNCSFKVLIFPVSCHPIDRVRCFDFDDNLLINQKRMRHHARQRSVKMRKHLHLGIRGKRAWLLALSLLCFCTTAVAQTPTTYISAHSGSWNNPSTWSPAGVPGTVEGDEAIIDAGHTVTLDVSPTNTLASVTVYSNGTLEYDNVARTLKARDVTVNSLGKITLQNSAITTHQLRLEPLSGDPANVATTFQNNGTVDLVVGTAVCTTRFSRSTYGPQSLTGTGTFDLGPVIMENFSATLLPTVLNAPAETQATQTIGQSGGSSIQMQMQSLEINNQVGQVRFAVTIDYLNETPRYREDNPTVVLAKLKISGNLILKRGILILNRADNTSLDHSVGSIQIGSSTSTSVYGPDPNGENGVLHNTGIAVVSATNATTNLTVTGNVTAPSLSHANEGVTIMLVSPASGNGLNNGSTSGAIMTVDGNFNLSGARLDLVGNGTIFFPWAGDIRGGSTGNIAKGGFANGAEEFNFKGDFKLKNGSRYNGWRSGGAGTGVPRIRFIGTTLQTFTVHPNVWIGTSSLDGETNAISFWRVESGAQVKITPGSGIAIHHNGYSLTVNGTLIAEDGAELVATKTGGASGNTVLTMGPNGIIRVADPQGLGNGNQIDPTSNFPLFIGRTSPGSPAPTGWDLTSISSNGTIEYNGTVTQAVTARTYNNLVINNTGGTATQNSSPPPFFLFNNPNIVEGNITANSVELWRGVFILTPVGSGGSFAHTFGTLSIGSATSLTTFPSSSNTVLVINNRPSSTVTLTVSNVSGASSATGGVGMVMGGINCNSLCNTTLTVNGNFTFSVPLYLAGNLSVFSPGGSGTNILEFGGNVSLANTCRFSGDRFGVGADPTIRLTGASATFTVPSVVWLGTGGETNILAKWEIPLGASITLPSGSSIACSNGRNFTLNGTLIAQDGAEMIATQTGPTPPGATSNLIMGTNATLRIGDVHGMGTGALIGSNPQLPPPNAPTFFRQQSPASGTPNGWNLTSINTNGTVDYNGTALQTITARNPSTAPNTQYHRLTISGANKTLESTNGSVVVNDQLTLQGGIVSSVNASDVVRVLNNATGAVTHTSGHINARLERAVTGVSQTYLFPIGDNTTYRQISLTLTSTSLLGTSLRAELIDGNANSLPGVGVNSPLQKVSDLRYYSFLNTGTNNVTILQVQNMAINADDAVNQVTSNTTLKIATRVSGNWQSQGPSSSVNTSGLPTTFSSDTFSESVAANSTFFVSLGTTNPTDDPLPVELVGFKGEATVLGVVLQWQTASERDNAGFMLVRNGEVIADYREHAALRGAGTSAVGRRYQFVDERVREGERYVYALRSVDFDGTVHDYAVRVEVEGKRVSREYELMQNYPNPFNPVTTIRYVLPEESEVRVRVYDMLGRMVKEVVGGLRQGAGVYEVRFEGSGLGSGVYVYRLEAVGSRGRYVASKKMVLMK